jgi:hypothetical protein
VASSLGPWQPRNRSASGNRKVAELFMVAISLIVPRRYTDTEIAGIGRTPH